MSAFDLQDDGFCFACGKANPSGLGLEFRNEKQKMVAEFTPLKAHQGYKNIVHGGIITAVLDEAMIKAASAGNIPAVTADIAVRFRKPLFVGDRAVVEAEILRVRRRNVVETFAVLMKAGVLVASATARMVRHG